MINYQMKLTFHIGYLIYDDTGKIFAYSENFEEQKITIYDKKGDPVRTELINTEITESEKYLAKERFNAQSREELKKHFVSNQARRPESFIRSKNICLSRIYSYLNGSKTSKELIDLSNLHILIIDPIYYIDKNLDTPYQLENTIFEFILDI